MYLAMAAVLLMACDPNGNVSGNEKKALNQGAVKALSAVGEDAQVMDKALMDLGFTRTILAAEGTSANDLKLDGAVFYLYNVPTKYIVSQDGGREVINEIVKANKVGIAISAVYTDSKLARISGVFFVNADTKDVNNLYIGLSNAMYSGKPSGAEVKQWLATIESTGKSYEKRADFEPELASFKAGQLAESCVFAVGTKQVYYSLSWAVPDEAARKDLEKDGITPYCMGTFYVE